MRRGRLSPARPAVVASSPQLARPNLKARCHHSHTQSACCRCIAPSLLDYLSASVFTPVHAAHLFPSCDKQPTHLLVLIYLPPTLSVLSACSLCPVCLSSWQQSDLQLQQPYKQSSSALATVVRLSTGSCSLLHGHGHRRCASTQRHERLQPLRMPLRGSRRLRLFVPPHRRPVLLVMLHQRVNGGRLSTAAARAAAARLCCRLPACRRSCCCRTLPCRRCCAAWKRRLNRRGLLQQRTGLL